MHIPVLYVRIRESMHETELEELNKKLYMSSEIFTINQYPVYKSRVNL